MHEKPKPHEDSSLFPDQLRLSHPDTFQAESAWAKSNQEGASFLTIDREASSMDAIKETIAWMHGVVPRERTLFRRTPNHNYQAGKDMSFCIHKTYMMELAYSACIEHLIARQTDDYLKSKGSVDVRVYYPWNWPGPQAIWLTSRSDNRQESNPVPMLPDISLLAFCDHQDDSLRGNRKKKILQIDHGYQEETIRLITIEGHTITGAWGYRNKVSSGPPPVLPWGFGSDFCPLEYKYKLRSLIWYADKGKPSDLPTSVVLDGLIDCKRVTEEIRSQAQTGPVDLSRLFPI